MSQMTLSDYEYSKRKKKTKREEFLDVMEDIIPWDEWVEFVRPYYPNGKRGRPTKGIEKMMRMYLLQVWFNLSDEGIEDAIYDSYAFRKFMGIDFNEEQVPDATTLLKFRHLLEKNHLGEQMFKAMKYLVDKLGLCHDLRNVSHLRNSLYLFEKIAAVSTVFLSCKICKLYSVHKRIKAHCLGVVCIGQDKSCKLLSHQ